MRTGSTPDSNGHLFTTFKGEWLDKLLAMFIISIHKSDKTEYEPDSITSKFNSIARYCREKHYEFDIHISPVFQRNLDVLSSKRKQLKSHGLRNKARKAEPITQEDIQKLKDAGQLGSRQYILITFSLNM